MNKPLHKFGLGLRSKHYEHILAHKPQLDFFEIISENFMDNRGRPREKLLQISGDYPILTHGVSLSIGSTDPLNMDYLTRLKNFADETQPLHVSDHLCWTGINGKNTHDLLPVPLTEESLNHVVERIRRVQDFLKRKILIENPSTYLTFRADYIPEYEFMAELAKRADCGILLDVNNVYVSAFNHRLSAQKYIDAIPMERVAQIHLAGHTHKGTHIVDTHDDHVTNDVWDLYAYTIAKATHPINVMVEWDGNIPEFEVLENELQKAREWRIEIGESKSITITNLQSPVSNLGLLSLQSNLQTAIHNAETDGAYTWIADKPNFPPDAQLEVYIAAYRIRIHDVIADDYEVMRHYLGNKKFAELIKDFIAENYSEYYDMGKYSEKFAVWAGQQNIDLFAKELTDLEKNISNVYTMQNSPAAKPEDFEGVAPEDFVQLKLRPRQASTLVYYQNDVNGYLSDYLGDKKSVKPQKRKVYLIIYRKDDKAFRLELEKDEFEMLQEMQATKTIGEAMEAKNPEDIQQWFAKWISNSVLSLSH